MQKFGPFLCTCFLVAHSAAFSQSLIPQEIRASVTEHVKGGYAPGIVVAVYNKGQTEYFSYGHTDAGKKLAVNEHTIFEIGSITKTITAYLAAHSFANIHDRDLIVRQMLTADDKQNMQIWEQAGERPIDVKDLLNHTSAFPRLPGNFAPADPQNPYIDYTRAKLLESFAELKLKQGPGISPEYSNYAFGLLTMLIEDASGKSYAELLQERLAQPLNMQRTVLDEAKIEGFNKAIGHVSTERMSDWEFDVMVGAGGVRSTPADMLLYVRAYLQAAQLDTAKTTANSNETEAPNPELLAVYRAMQDCMVETFNLSDGTGIALGWHTRQIGEEGQQRTAYWHNGQTGGFHSVTAFSPEDDQAIVVLCNSVANIDALAFRYFDDSVELPTVRTVIELSTQDMQKYTGSYPLAPQFVINVFVEGEKLMAQATNQPPFQIFPESTTRFFYKVVDADIEFNFEDGKVTGFTLFQNGQEIPAKKTAP